MSLSCLGGGGDNQGSKRPTSAGGTTCLHINTLACLTGTILGVASVTKCLYLRFKG